MMSLFRSVTVRSVLETLFFGKPGATAQERRNYLCWGHPEPRPEHKVILLVTMMLAALMLILITVDAGAAPHDLARTRGMSVEPTRIIVPATLGRPLA